MRLKSATAAARVVAYFKRVGVRAWILTGRQETEYWEKIKGLRKEKRKRKREEEKIEQVKGPKREKRTGSGGVHVRFDDEQEDEDQTDIVDCKNAIE